MPRYFFNIRIGEDLIPDPDGEELRNPITPGRWPGMIRQLSRNKASSPICSRLA